MGFNGTVIGKLVNRSLTLPHPAFSRMRQKACGRRQNISGGGDLRRYFVQFGGIQVYLSIFHFDTEFLRTAFIR